mmetsp:Transcript_66727/g.139297  ORF Transcript_66727/g.139297 Transcript_66727/m.139297 type:complete len:203 (-) Transcript_66727:2054-2662(-)
MGERKKKHVKLVGSLSSGLGAKLNTPDDQRPTCALPSFVGFWFVFLLFFCCLRLLLALAHLLCPYERVEQQPSQTYWTRVLSTFFPPLFARIAQNEGRQVFEHMNNCRGIFKFVHKQQELRKSLQVCKPQLPRNVRPRRSSSFSLVLLLLLLLAKNSPMRGAIVFINDLQPALLVHRALRRLNLPCEFRELQRQQQPMQPEC